MLRPTSHPLIALAALAILPFLGGGQANAGMVTSVGGWNPAAWRVTPPSRWAEPLEAVGEVVSCSAQAEIGALPTTIWGDPTPAQGVNLRFLPRTSGLPTTPDAPAKPGSDREPARVCESGCPTSPPQGWRAARSAATRNLLPEPLLGGPLRPPR